MLQTDHLRLTDYRIGIICVAIIKPLYYKDLSDTNFLTPSLVEIVLLFLLS